MKWIISVDIRAKLLFLYFLLSSCIFATDQIIDFHYADENHILYTIQRNDELFLKYGNEELGPYNEIQYSLLFQKPSGGYAIQSLVRIDDDWTLLLDGYEKKIDSINIEENPITEWPASYIKYDLNDQMIYTFCQNGDFYIHISNEIIGPFNSTIPIAFLDDYRNSYITYENEGISYLLKNGIEIMSEKSLELRYNKNREIYIKVEDENGNKFFVVDDTKIGPFQGRAVSIFFNTENDYYIKEWIEDKVLYHYADNTYGPYYNLTPNQGLQEVYFKNGNLGFLYLKTKPELRINDVWLNLNGEEIDLPDSLRNSIIGIKIRDDKSFVYYNGQFLFNENNDKLGEYRSMPNNSRNGRITLGNSYYVLPNSTSLQYITVNPNNGFKTLHQDEIPDMSFQYIYPVQEATENHYGASDKYVIAGNKLDNLTLYYKGSPLLGSIDFTVKEGEKFHYSASSYDRKFRIGSSHEYVTYLKESDYSFKRIRTDKDSVSHYSLDDIKFNSYRKDGISYIDFLDGREYEGRVLEYEDHVILCTIENNVLVTQRIDY